MLKWIMDKAANAFERFAAGMRAFAALLRTKAARQAVGGALVTLAFVPVMAQGFPVVMQVVIASFLVYLAAKGFGAFLLYAFMVAYGWRA